MIKARKKKAGKNKKTYLFPRFIKLWVLSKTNNFIIRKKIMRSYFYSKNHINGFVCSTVITNCH